MRDLDPGQAVQRSLVKRFRKELWQPFVAACKRYGLVPEGTRAAAPLDGCAPSLLGALLLRELHRHSDVPFTLVFPAAEEALETAARLGLEAVPVRGDLRAWARSAGCDRLAAWDCMSDVTEAALTAMLREGETRAIPPLEGPGADGLTLIRPLYCVEARDIRAFCRYNSLSCPMPPADPRRRMARDLLEEVKQDSPNAEISVFRSLHAVHGGTFPRVEEP